MLTKLNRPCSLSSARLALRADPVLLFPSAQKGITAAMVFIGFFSERWGTATCQRGREMTKEDGERQQKGVWIINVWSYKTVFLKQIINVRLERSALPLMSSSPFLLRLSEVCSIHGLLGLLGEILHSGGPKWQLDKLCPTGMNGTYTAFSLSRWCRPWGLKKKIAMLVNWKIEG